MNSDLISRGELKKAFAESNHIFETTSCLDVIEMLAVYEIIDNAPTVEYTFEEAFQRTVCENKLYCPARPQGEWIPVSERLPEKEGFYLVFLENGEMAVAHSDGIIANHNFEPKMLAWRPLPEPYKEGGTEK